MGTENVGNTDSNIKQSESKTTGSTKTGSTRNRSTKTTGTGTGSGTVGTGSGNVGTGSGNVGTGSGTVETGSTKGIKVEKNSKVPVLNDLPEVNIPEPQTKQKRKYTKKPKEEKTETFNAEQLTTLIVAVSSMASTRFGSHWLLSKTEAEQIAKPLSNIIEKSEKIKSLGEHADAFALVTACLMIFTPRLIASLQINKAKKGVKKANGFKHISKPDTNGTDGRISTGSGQQHNEGKITNSNKSADSGNIASITNVNQSLFEAVEGE